MARIPHPGPRITLLCLVLVALAAGFAPAAHAQGGGNRVEEELQRTDEVLARAADLVRESDSARARDLLEQAFRIQAEARGHFGNGRMLQAGRLTLEARALGARAATLARDDGASRTRAERELERAIREIGHARERLATGASREADALLDQAAGLAERARGAFGEQQYEASLRLAVASQRLVAQALVLGGANAGRRLDRELERTDLLLERVGTIVHESGDAAAGALLESAHAMQRRAHEAARDGHPREAMVRTREARDLANRARASLGGAEDHAAVEAAVAATDAALARAADLVRASDSRAAATLLERAQDHQSRAHAALDAGDLRRAMAQTRVARNLALRALQLVDRGES